MVSKSINACLQLTLIYIDFMLTDEHIAIPAPGELQLYAITLAEAGIYKCIATNDAGTAAYTCQLKVNEGKSQQSCTMW